MNKLRAKRINRLDSSPKSIHLMVRLFAILYLKTIIIGQSRVTDFILEQKHI